MLEVNKLPAKIGKVCIMWQTDSAFMAEFLLRMNYIVENKAQTMGVGFWNKRLTLWYNEEFVEKLPIIELEAVLVHEVLHILHKFHERLGSRQLDIFNVAQDICINDIVEKTSIAGRSLKLPELACRLDFVRKKGYHGDVISEPIYDFLYKNAPKLKIKMIGASCPSCGGTGKKQSPDDPNNSKGEKCPDCGGSGKQKGNGEEFELYMVDDHGHQKELTDIEKEMVQEIINNAKVKSYGNISGSLQSAISELTKTKTLPWRKTIRMLLSKYINEPGGIYENTWVKRNRRNLPLPGIRKLNKKVVISIDTSGSISDKDIGRFFDQIEKIVKDYSILTIIEWDVGVHKVYTYKKGDWKRVKIEGRGGTNIQCVYDHIKEKIKDTTVVINFTDGEFNWDISHYNISTIWAFVNKSIDKAPFGKSLHIKD